MSSEEQEIECDHFYTDIEFDGVGKVTIQCNDCKQEFIKQYNPCKDHEWRVGDEEVNELQCLKCDEKMSLF